MTSLKCPVCGRPCKSLQSVQTHTVKFHDLNAERCYNICCPDTLNNCIDCGSQTKFVSFVKGYQLRCLKCSKIFGANKAAISRRLNYRQAWNAGQTKDTSQSVKKISDALKQHIKQTGGKGYINAHMSPISETQSRFWWTDYHNRYDRFTIRANKAQNLTENEVATLNNVVRIWGTPNLIFSD